ncbi:MAG: HypC/HybG/HupF family hydrogenase formation chaperone [Candidatus Jacksonbacteria bacterium]|nr:HypC/HybG/HupF family hydrogenase formation chaperone [Candidatus Jacksonbacteria bacterium]
MCLAIPGKIVSVSKNTATVSYAGDTRTAKIVTGFYKKGDYVIAQAGMVIEKVPKKQVDSWDEFLKHDAR